MEYHLEPQYKTVWSGRSDRIEYYAYIQKKNDRYRNWTKYPSEQSAGIILKSESSVAKKIQQGPVCPDDLEGSGSDANLSFSFLIDREGRSLLRNGSGLISNEIPLRADRQRDMQIVQDHVLRNLVEQ